MLETKRKFYVTKPEMIPEMIDGISTIRDGIHLELFYNLIFSNRNIKLPDHLRPIVWALGDKNIENLMVIISPGSGKSFLTGIAYPLWELGLDQNHTILGISAGADLMMKWLQSTMDIIEHSQVYKILFPNIKPDKDMGWSRTTAFVQRTISGEPNPSYEALGYGSKKIVGSHAKVLVIDDIHDDENSQSSDSIEKVEDFYYRTLIGRKDPQGSRMVMIGRRWAADDLYGRLKDGGTWLVMTLANFRDTPELYYEMRIPPNLACVFNDFQAKPEPEDIQVVYGENNDHVGFFWTGPIDNPLVKTKYSEVMEAKRNKPYIFETVYQSNPESSSNKIFSKTDFRDFVIPSNMYIGRIYGDVVEFLKDMDFDLIVQSWDTAATAETSNDPSVGYTIGLKGCTKNHRSTEPKPEDVPYHYDLYVLDEIYRRLQIGDLKVEVKDYHDIWRPNYVIVENSVVGIPIIQSLESDSIQVVAVNVQNKSKRSRALNGTEAGSAQGWAKQGNILIPQRTLNGDPVPWANDLLNELDGFTGARGRRDDRVDSIIQAANFAIELGVRNRDLPEGWRTAEEIDERLLKWQKPNNIFEQYQTLLRNVSNPMYGLCGTCKFFNGSSFCNFHKRAMTKFGSCPRYDVKDGVSPIMDTQNGRK
jgi:phage terminase large subunit-like protein